MMQNESIWINNMYKHVMNWILHSFAILKASDCSNPPFEQLRLQKAPLQQEVHGRPRRLFFFPLSHAQHASAQANAQVFDIKVETWSKLYDLIETVPKAFYAFHVVFGFQPGKQCLHGCTFLTDLAVDPRWAHPFRWRDCPEGVTNSSWTSSESLSDSFSLGRMFLPKHTPMRKPKVITATSVPRKAVKSP